VRAVARCGPRAIPGGLPEDEPPEICLSAHAPATVGHELLSNAFPLNGTTGKGRP
jgi:hypothetical protein